MTRDYHNFQEKITYIYSINLPNNGLKIAIKDVRCH